MTLRRLVLALLALVLLAPLAPTTAVAATTSGRTTAREYWRLDDVCRGSSDPEVWRPACRKRDRALKAMGRETFDRFHAAWKRNDRRAMRRHLAPGVVVGPTRAARVPADCRYAPGEPWWSCYVRIRGGGGFDVVMGVTRYQRPGLPRWKVIRIIVDCC